MFHLYYSVTFFFNLVLFSLFLFFSLSYSVIVSEQLFIRIFIRYFGMCQGQKVDIVFISLILHLRERVIRGDLDRFRMR